MTAARIQSGYFSHPKVIGLSDPAKLLHLASILWTAEHLTDGHLPHSALRLLSDTLEIGSRWRVRRSSELVIAGLWDLVLDERGGWMVHDFTEHNRFATRAYVEHEREQARARIARMRARQNGEH